MNSNPTPTQSCTKKGCVIRLHLREGNPQGKIEAKLDNWVGRIVRGHRSDLDWLLNHKRAQQPGVYLLQGKNLDLLSGDKKSVYIGLSDRNLQSRLRAHDKDEDMDFWETACLITANDGTMNPSNCSYLEAKLIEQARRANRAHIFNKNNPSLPNLECDEKQEAENFIDNLSLLLPMMNIDFLNPLRATDESIKDFMFEIFHQPSGIRARANEVNGDFFILEGSCASIERLRTNQTPKNESDREALLKDKTLEKSKDKKSLIFTKNSKFSSPSAAASVVLNGHAGVREWKIKETKEDEDYSHWRGNPSKFNFS